MSNMAKELAVVLILALALVGYLEYRNAPTEKAIREEARSAYLRPCDATISDRLHYVDAVSPRCYFFKDRR
jgi:hypothetical protein